MPRDQKKIDVWKYDSNGNLAEVTVSILRNQSHGPATTFRADSAELGICIRNSDIGELKAAVDKAIDRALIREYSEFFWITFEGIGRGDDVIVAEHYAFGGKVHGRSTLVIEKIYLSNDEPKVYKLSTAGDVRDWNRSTDSSYINTRCALIPSTMETRAGLREILAGFEMLNKQLSDLLDAKGCADRITLIGRPGGRFLNAGPAEPGNKGT